jgi:putative iron-dependent peroxidase
MASQPLPQAAVLGPVPALGRFLVFGMQAGVDPHPALQRLRGERALDHGVLGIGAPLALAVGAKVPGLRPFPAVAGPGVALPSTQGALWTFLGGDSAGDLHDRAERIKHAAGEGFFVQEEVAAFRYAEGRDLSGYVDGTANPQGAGAVAAAVVSGRGPGLDGGTFVAVQKYVHDLERFAGFAAPERDRIVGRRHSDNEEMADAPPSAHVKRAEQEAFDPPAFLVRRSMPWGGVGERGLYFVAYGESLDRFERVLARMAGCDDGVVDGLFRFTRAVSGGYYFCPPTKDGQVDWTALGI